MNEGPQFIDLIFLAVIAIMLIRRLYNVLGQTSEDEENREKKYSPDNNVIDFTKAKHTDIEISDDDEVSDKERLLNRIQRIDPEFDERKFLDGASIAFKMIIRAFAEGDKETLEPLLNEKVMQQFSSVIDERKKSENIYESEVVRFASKEITDAQLINSYANIEVKFVTEQYNTERDKDGKLVRGSLDRVETVTDIWTFSRDVSSRDPNWTLVGTRSA